MKNALAGVGAVVDDRSPTGRLDASFMGDATRRKQETPQERRILGRSMVQRFDVALGNDETVCRSHRPDVGKGQELVVLEQNLGGYLFLDDLAKEAHHDSPVAGGVEWVLR